jgi:hypothetical protein
LFDVKFLAMILGEPDLAISMSLRSILKETSEWLSKLLAVLKEAVLLVLDGEGSDWGLVRRGGSLKVEKDRRIGDSSSEPSS